MRSHQVMFVNLPTLLFLFCVRQIVHLSTSYLTESEDVFLWQRCNKVLFLICDLFFVMHVYSLIKHNCHFLTSWRNCIIHCKVKDYSIKQYNQLICDKIIWCKSQEAMFAFHFISECAVCVYIKTE